MKVVTNGTFLPKDPNRPNDPPIPRRFNVIAERGPWMWVEPLNGFYANEGPLTFRKADLKEVKK